MEDILDVYALPYDKSCPVICIDEKPYQLLDERREPLPMKKGKTARFDNEYERKGTCSIFVMTEPLRGWCRANARERRTAVDFAHEIDWLLNSPESPYKDVPKIKLLSDNLNTHNNASLYKAFPAPYARKLRARIEWHRTPKHGSWLNIAEIVISILEKQCINRRIADIITLNAELAAWGIDRNTNCKGVNWQFRAEDAWVRLRGLYPVV